MAMSKKKKALLIGLGIFLVLSAVTLAIVLPLTLGKSKDKDPEKPKPIDDKPVVKTKITTNVASSNERQVNIEMNQLDPYLNSELTIEYQQLSKSADENALLVKTFQVNAATQYLIISQLKSGIEYSYQIKNAQGDIISDKITFKIAPKRELAALGEKNSISFESVERNEKYLRSKMTLGYSVYKGDENAPSTKHIPVSFIATQENGKIVYKLRGQITNLEESTPYILKLYLENEQEPISEHVIVWTKGDNPKLIASAMSAKTATIQASGIDRYIKNPQPGVSFSLSYIKKNSSEASKTTPLVLGTSSVIFTELTSLDKNSEYSVSLMKTEKGKVETLAGPISFWTLPQPFINSKTYDSFATNWRKSTKQALTIVSGLRSSNQNLSQHFDFSKLEAIAVEISAASDIPDFKNADAVHANLSVETTKESDDYLVKFTNLKPGKLYAVQLFYKTDTTFAKPILEKDFVNGQMPNYFEVQSSEIDLNSAKITINNINNYKSGEIILKYWKKSQPSNQFSKTISFEGSQTSASLTLDSLEKLTEYQYQIVPIYKELQDTTDNLLNEVKEFETIGSLTALAIKGNHFSDNVTFGLGEVSKAVPLNKDLKLQWRVKNTSNSSWEAPNTKNSVSFNIAAIPSDHNYEIKVANNNRVDTWFTGVTYEWRVIDPANASVNLIKTGNSEFSFEDNKLESTFTDKISNIARGALRWRQPQYENIVANGLGDSYLSSTYRSFFGLSSKEDWKHFMEWLAFQETTIQDKVIKNLIMGFKAYVSTGHKILLNIRATAVPFLPGGTNGNKETTFQTKANDDDPIFGGYNASNNTGDSPIKPSDFMSGIGKFTNWNAFEKAIRYTLNGFKDGWNNRSKAFGISRNNIFADGYALSKSQTYASYLTKKFMFNGNFNLSANSSTDANGWSLSVVEPTGTSKNVYANDIKGELFIKVKATKGDKIHYYWHKITGFKTTTAGEKAKANDLSFELYKDHSKSARLIAWEINKAVGDAAKKAVVEKYYKVRLDSIFNNSWKFVSANLSSDGNTINLKATIASKSVANSTIENLDGKLGDLSSTEQFSYTLSGFNLSSLPTIGLTWSVAKGDLSTSESSKAFKVRFYNMNWTYQQFLDAAQDAYIRGTSAVSTLANQIFNNFNLATEWNEPKTELYFRPMGENPLYDIGDYVMEPSDKLIVFLKNKGFSPPIRLIEVNDEEKKKLLIQMINSHGKK